MNPAPFVILAVILTTVFAVGFALFIYDLEEPIIETFLDYPYRHCSEMDWNVSFLTEVMQYGELSTEDREGLLAIQSTLDLFDINETTINVFSSMLSYNDHHNFTLVDSWHYADTYFGLWTRVGKAKMGFVIPGVNSTIVITSEGSLTLLLHWIQEAENVH